MKHEIVQFASLSKDALHIYVGMGVFLLGAAVAQKGIRSALAILAVVALAALGEMLDARDDLRIHGHWRVMASLHDLVNTVFWPLMLWLLARYSRVLK
ncbi:MAG: hypothetical protein U1F39_05795 [Steroidobacteraceae bacterium]